VESPRRITSQPERRWALETLDAAVAAVTVRKNDSPAVTEAITNVAGVMPFLRVAGRSKPRRVDASDALMVTTCVGFVGAPLHRRQPGFDKLLQPNRRGAA